MNTKIKTKKESNSKRFFHIENSEEFKNLTVNKGVENKALSSNKSIDAVKKARKNILKAEDYFKGIRAGNLTILSRAITLVESSNPKHKELASKIVDLCLPYSGKSKRIGITGVPGVGKSTFIEALGTTLIAQGEKMAVLAIDPSSEKSKGSILGDKTRMEELVKSPNAFIRPSPSSGSLGGVARKTRETILLCEAAGYTTIFVETVGVGQSETAVHSMTDFFLLLMLAGAGDELQGIKRGIMEMADTIAITKADGDNKIKAIAAETEYRNALHLFPPSESKWAAKVLSCSSVTHWGIDDLWNTIKEYFDLCTENGQIEHKRKQQAKFWMHETIKDQLLDFLYNDKNNLNVINQLEKDIMANKTSPFKAADHVFELFLNKKS